MLATWITIHNLTMQQKLGVKTPKKKFDLRNKNLVADDKETYRSTIGNVPTEPLIYQIYKDFTA